MLKILTCYPIYRFFLEITFAITAILSADTTPTKKRLSFRTSKKLIYMEKNIYRDILQKEDLIIKEIMNDIVLIKSGSFMMGDKTSDDETFQAHYRSRRRTEKFFKDFKIYDDWSDLERPFVWQMVKEAAKSLAENLGGVFSNADVRDYILKKYGNVNENTINSQIIVCTVNHDSRINYPINNKPRVSAIALALV